MTLIDCEEKNASFSGTTRPCNITMPRKLVYTCSKCKGSFCNQHIGQYVDGNNISITKNSPYYCKSCYKEKYGY